LVPAKAWIAAISIPPKPSTSRNFPINSCIWHLMEIPGGRGHLAAEITAYGSTICEKLTLVAQ
jgi:hypothetical protein